MGHQTPSAPQRDFRHRLPLRNLLEVLTTQQQHLPHRPRIPPALLGSRSAILLGGRLDYLPRRVEGKPLLLTTDEELHGVRQAAGPVDGDNQR